MAVRNKLFPGLSEDAWLLYASGYGGETKSLEFAVMDSFVPTETPPKPSRIVALHDLLHARGRLRRWLLPQCALELYSAFEHRRDVVRLGSLADVGIGYVSGANDFFHLRDSDAKRLNIPKHFLRAAVRRGSSVPNAAILSREHVREWVANDLALYLQDQDTTTSGTVTDPTGATQDQTFTSSQAGDAGHETLASSGSNSLAFSISNGGGGTNVVLGYGIVAIAPSTAAPYIPYQPNYQRAPILAQ